MNELPVIDNKSILTPTSGFLGSSYTHSLNAYSGCGYHSSSCGVTYCYCMHNNWLTKGREWSLYGVKKHLGDAYAREYDRLKWPRRGDPKRLVIYMSSSTDPYMPQERLVRATESILTAMVERPPDALVIQTRGPLIERDLELIKKLSSKSKVWVSITVETDYEKLSGFPPHPSSPARRLQVASQFSSADIPTQVTVSPLLPLRDIDRFSDDVLAACDRVILDHYLLGDGSHGMRTKRGPLPGLLEDAGFGRWNTLEKFNEVVSAFRSKSNNVLISADGFNSL